VSGAKQQNSAHLDIQHGHPTRCSCGKFRAGVLEEERELNLVFALSEFVFLSARE
jgi:hypothetical protein